MQYKSDCWFFSELEGNVFYSFIFGFRQFAIKNRTNGTVKFISHNLHDIHDNSVLTHPASSFNTAAGVNFLDDRQSQKGTGIVPICVLHRIPDWVPFLLSNSN